MKQTAVEWLVEQLVELDKQLDGRRKNDDATVLKLNPTKLFEQAKEMEKKQNQREMSDKNKETELLRASLMQQVSELNDDEIIYLYDELSEFFKTKER